MCERAAGTWTERSDCRSWVDALVLRIFVMRIRRVDRYPGPRPCDSIVIVIVIVIAIVIIVVITAHNIDDSTTHFEGHLGHFDGHVRCHTDERAETAAEHQRQKHGEQEQ